ncbi:acyltransferase family protein [Methylobacterium radiodurans]|uniref:acyltransferase family protein n=1 Tax=Methylobacterium radiodurans TaxID=2202828 RepID=UPI0013A55D70|nr:acyltransferase [Methylobacterium radiodurans]
MIGPFLRKLSANRSHSHKLLAVGVPPKLTAMLNRNDDGEEPDSSRWPSVIRSSTKIAPELSIWLDAIRGLAAVAVVLSHINKLMYSQASMPAEGAAVKAAYTIVNIASSFGHSAVIMFFALSGYLVGGGATVRSIRGQQQLVPYAVARAARIGTVLLPGLAVTAATTLVALHFFDLTGFIAHRANFYPAGADIAGSLGLRVALCNVASLQMIACNQYGLNVSLWSLSNEVIYYVLFGVLLIGRWWSVVLFVASVLALSQVEGIEPNDLDRASIYLVGLLIWLLAAALFAVDKAHISLRLGVGAAVLCILLAAVLLNPMRPGVGRDLLIGLCSLGALFLLEKGRLRSHLVERLGVQRLAPFSFTLYLIHFPVVQLVLCALSTAPFNQSATSLAVQVVVFAAALVFAYALYLVSEAHTERVRGWMLRAVTVRQRHL